MVRSWRRPLAMVALAVLLAALGSPGAGTGKHSATHRSAHACRLLTQTYPTAAMNGPDGMQTPVATATVIRVHTAPAVKANA